MHNVGEALALVLWATAIVAILFSPVIAFYVVRFLYRRRYPPRKKWMHNPPAQSTDHTADFRLDRRQRTVVLVGLGIGVILFGVMLIVWNTGSRDICTIHDINPLMLTHKCWDDKYVPLVGFGAAILIGVSAFALVLSWTNRPSKSS